MDKKSIRHHMFLHMSVGGFRLWQRFLRIFICRIFLRERSTVVMQRRFVCGFLCPFGWFQELLHKIPFKKISTRKLKPLRFIKYGILLVFVILLPILVTNQLGMGDPFLQIPLSTGSIRGGTSTFDCKCRHPCGIGKAVYMEGRNTGCGRVVKPYVLSPVLQMDLSAWRSLCAF